MNYPQWKSSVLGKVLNVDGVNRGQCTQVDLDYGEALFPGIAWSVVFPPTPLAKNFLAVANTKYFEVVINNHSDVNQVPVQGDIMVFDATPEVSYTNTFKNTAGHTGVCDSANTEGYELVQQNAPAIGSAVNVSEYAWNFRPCLGWLHPKTQPEPFATGLPATLKTVFLPSSVQKWRVYKVAGPWTVGSEIAYLWPSKFAPGLTYNIEATLAPNIYKVKTLDFGDVAIYAGSDTDAVIK